jgi:hypothetical protein
MSKKQALRLFEKALLVFAVAFAVFAALSVEQPPETEDVALVIMQWSFAAAALGSVAIAHFVAKSEARKSVASGMSEKQARIQSRFLRIMALESILIGNLGMWMMSGQQWPNAVMAVIPFCFAVAQAVMPIPGADGETES